MSQLSCRGISFYSLLFISGIFYSAHGQTQSNRISGVITDSATGEPIAFANVFFANTRIGVSSDTLGKFELKNIPNGKYDFTVAYVGYEPYQQAFDFAGSEYRLTISLKPAEVKLNEVVVKADTTGWARNFATFKRHFLGETKNALHCRILNPRDIHLYYDTRARVLVAHASKPVVVENRALGFTIQYHLQKFELDYTTGRLDVFGIPSFQDLFTKRDENKQWQRERLRAYNGSMIHFIRALRRDSLAEVGFNARKLYRVSNPKRPSDEYLNQKINLLHRKLSKGGVVKVGENDSLRYYLELRALPKLVDSIASNEVRASEIMNAPDQVTYQGLLRVDYLREREEPGYAQIQGRASIKLQRSVIHFLSSNLKIYTNGYYENAYDVFIEEYWSWSEKISELLPLDYEPPLGRKK